MQDSGAAGADAPAAFLLAPSPRQAACLTLAARGCSEREMALQLGVAPATVRNHLLRARRRLGARNTTEAVVRALRAGWLIEDDEPCGAAPARTSEESCR